MELVREIFVWLFAIVAIGGIGGLFGWGIFAWVKDVWEACLAKTCPTQTITTWYVYIVFSNSLKYIFEESDDTVPDAQEQAQTIYNRLIFRKTATHPLWHVRDSEDDRLAYDISLVEEIRMHSSSYRVAVLPSGKRRVVYS